MVQRTYLGLGPPDRARVEFAALTPWVRDLKSLQQECPRLGPDWLALSIPLDSLQTAAYHFTRRPDFYADIAPDPAPTPHQDSSRAPQQGNRRLADPDEALAAFTAFRPYVERLRALQQRCRPYGPDYAALDLARQGLFTAAFHFTRNPHLYAGAPPISFN